MLRFLGSQIAFFMTNKLYKISFQIHLTHTYLSFPQPFYFRLLVHEEIVDEVSIFHNTSHPLRIGHSISQQFLNLCKLSKYSGNFCGYWQLVI